MPLTRQQKEDIIGTIKQVFADSVIAIFLNFHGLSVKDSTTMRRDFLKNGLKYHVVKKTLLSRAISNHFGKQPPELKGEIGVVFGSDPLTATKEVVRIAKAIKALTVQGGWWENAFMGVSQIVALAAIPSREVLLTQLIMVMNAPMRNLIGAFADIPRKFIGTLEAIKNIKET